MSDPARLLETNLDGTFRRAIDAALADEPPRGEQSRIWQSIALALPSGVLLGATTTAGAAAVGGSAAGVASNVAATSTAIGVASKTAGASTAVGSALKAAAAGGIASASAGVGVGVGAGVGMVSGGLGLVAAKAIAVGLGLGVIVNVTAVTLPDLVNASSAASAHVAPEGQLPPQRAKPKPVSPARFATAPAVAATSMADSAMADSPSTNASTDARAASAVATTITAPAAPRVAFDSKIHESPIGDAERAVQAERMDTSAASADELRDESRLLVRARQALNASNPALALQLLADHRQGFPAGRLVQERDALEVQALQKSARHEEARARARAFLVHFPMSPHSEKMRAIAESSTDRR